MQAHRAKAIVSENGSLTIEKLPFPAGKPVEVVGPHLIDGDDHDEFWRGWCGSAGREREGECGQ